MTLIAELKDVTKYYGSRKVLDAVDLQIQKGEILALLGPNGSGKTTILKILAFIESPTSGEVSLQDEIVDFKKVEKVRLRSTLVFQRTVLFTASVYNNIAYGLKVRKTPKRVIEEEVRKALQLVKLEDFEKRNAKKLSVGEQQRVAIARALVLNTDLLLLDEPTANLDPKNAGILEEVIEGINREMKTTIVIATHNMFQAKTLPTRIALINEGKITEIGQPSDIFGKLSENLASFAALDNTFQGQAALTSQGTTLVDVGNGVKIEVTDQKLGEVTFFVSPQDIILSRQVAESSARNMFKGKIIEISDLGSLVKLKVDVGKTFMVQITKRSFVEMKLNLNSEVYLIFKASSVHLI